MKKLIVVCVFVATFSSQIMAFGGGGILGLSVSYATFCSSVLSTAGSWERKSEALKISNDIAIYDLTGEVRPSLSRFLEETKGEVTDQNINIINSVVEEFLTE